MAVGKQCERCGTDNPTTNNFCGQCGAALPALPIPVAEEEPQAKIGNDQTEAAVTPVDTASAGARDAASAVQRPSTRSASEDELPEWLRDLNAFQQEQPLPRPLPATAASTPDAPTEVVAATQHDLPAWLRADVEEPPTPPTSGTSPEDVPALPAWLTNEPDITPASPQVANGGEPPTEPARVSDAAGSSTVASAGIPSWLIESPNVAATPPADVTPSTPSQAETSMSSLPRWLLDDDEDDLPLPAPTPAADANTVPAQPPEDLPAWLRDTQPMNVSDGNVVAAQSDEDTLPAWLRDPQPAQESDDTAPSWVQAEALRQEPPIAAPSGSSDELGGARTYDFQSTAETSSPAMEVPSSTPRLPDWLLDADPAPGPGSETALGQGPNWLNQTPAEHDEATLPAWLRNQEGAPAPTPTTTSELPAWLLDPPADAAGPETAARSEQPDWLQMLGQADANNAGDSLISASAAQTDATPTRDDGASSTMTDAAQPARTMNAGNADGPRLPDWLLPTPEEAAMAAQPNTAEPEDDVPAWLRDFTTTPQPIAEQDAEPRPIDQWLTDTGPEPPSFAALPIPVSEESRARIYDVRDEETEIDAASPREESPPLPSWLVGKNNQTGEEPWALPPWLSEADTAQDKATLATIGSNDASAKVYDLPSWLQEDEATARAVAPSQVGSVPSWLEGENVTSAPVAAAEPVPAQRVIETPAPTTEERVAASSMLQRLTAEPEPEPVPIVEAPATRRSSIWLSTIIPLIVFLLIVAAIVYVLVIGPGLPSIFGSLLSPPLASVTPVFQRTQAVSPGVAQWQEQLAQLAPETPVLLVYATDGSRGAELAALEEGLVGQLQARSMPIVLMATDPQGALLSRQQTETTSTDAPMLNLGYKPGGVVAVARVANNFGSLFRQAADGRDLRDDVATLRTFCGSADEPVADCTLDRFGMVVVLADEPADPRTWVEQVGSVYGDLPLVFAVPAESAPYVRPYVLFGQATMLVGLNDAVALGALEGETSSILARQSDALAVGSAVWGVAALMGVVPAMLAGWLRRRKRQGDLWQR